MALNPLKALRPRPGSFCWSPPREELSTLTVFCEKGQVLVNLLLKTILYGGSLGSGVDEDRSELRYVMWIAELWSLTCWTHLAGLGSPEPMPVSGSAKNWSRNVISGIEALAPSFVWEHAFKIEVFAWLRASVALGTLSWVTLKRWPLKQDCPALVDKSECGQQTYDLRSGKSTR